MWKSTSELGSSRRSYGENIVGRPKFDFHTGGAPFILAYSCSKAALACFTKNTAAELRPHGIRVNQVNMGWCLTDAEDRGQSATNRFWLAEADAASPSGRILRPEDTAASVVHLLSESASMVTGAILDISPDMLPGIMSGETCC